MTGCKVTHFDEIDSQISTDKMRTLYIAHCRFKNSLICVLTTHTHSHMHQIVTTSTRTAIHSSFFSKYTNKVNLNIITTKPGFRSKENAQSEIKLY